MLDLLSREEVRDELVDDEAEDCIFCPCRPLVSYCGQYNDGPELSWEEAAVSCAECLRLYRTTGCPGCGCVRDEACRFCYRGGWWS